LVRDLNRRVERSEEEIQKDSRGIVIAVVDIRLFEDSAGISVIVGDPGVLSGDGINVLNGVLVGDEMLIIFQRLLDHSGVDDGVLRPGEEPDGRIRDVGGIVDELLLEKVLGLLDELVDVDPDRHVRAGDEGG